MIFNSHILYSISCFYKKLRMKRFIPILNQFVSRLIHEFETARLFFSNTFEHLQVSTVIDSFVTSDSRSLKICLTLLGK